MSDNVLLIDIKDVDIENYYSVKEVSKITKKAETTVRYWVREGKISSIKVMGPYGEQILIPKTQINNPVESKEVIVTKKELDIAIVSKTIAQCILDEISIELEKRDDKIDEILNVVKEMKDEKALMQQQIEDIQEKHFRELDKKLCRIMEEKQKQQSNEKSLFRKITSMFST